ncbi:MAG: transposase [Acidimicrobiales bacterium]
MSHETGHPLAVVCEVLKAPRSTVYARRASTAQPPRRPGPAGEITDDELVALIRQVLAETPFSGEGYRKVRAYLRRVHDVHVSGKRVLRLMRRHGLLAPQRDRRRRTERPHVGTIIPDRPNVRFGVDATLGWTKNDGWVWVFGCIDHYSCEAWSHVSKSGDRFSALQPVYDAVLERFGTLSPDVARGISVRHDWGSQYRSHHFTGSIRWLGMTDDPAYPGEPEGNGCIERWMKTLKEQCLWARLYEDTDDLRQAVASFTELYNSKWLIERHGHMTPREAYQAAMAAQAA